MVYETEIISLNQWITENVASFGIAILALIIVSLLIAFVSSALRHGPFDAIRLTIGTILTGVRELLALSPRRVYAMSKLSFQESIRRRVFVVFLVFFPLIMFGSWFLDRNSDHPARLYMSFVLTATNYLVILLAIFLSAFSIPNDVKNRTIFTVVTKPVRAGESVLGRMLGFCALGTVMLAIMCLISYVFVTRGVRHAHAVESSNLLENTIDVNGEQVTEQQGESSLVRRHRHGVTIGPDGKAASAPSKSHTHAVQVGKDGTVQLKAPRGMLQARVPVLGDLRFLDRSGLPVKTGVNVGSCCRATARVNSRNWDELIVCSRCAT